MSDSVSALRLLIHRERKMGREKQGEKGGKAVKKNEAERKRTKGDMKEED